MNDPRAPAIDLQRRARRQPAFGLVDNPNDVDMARLAKSIDQIALTYDFKNRPKAEDIFTSQYLPPAADRKL